MICVEEMEMLLSASEGVQTLSRNMTLTSSLSCLVTVILRQH